MIDLEQYYKEIEKGLEYQPRTQNKVLSDLRESVSAYIADHPDATINDIYEIFGTPERIVNDNQDWIPEIVVKKTKAYKIWLLGIVAIIVVAVAGIMLSVLIDGYKSNRGHAGIAGGEVVDVTRWAEIDTTTEATTQK